MKKFFFALILCFTVSLAFGVAIIQQPYTTNNTANADAHVISLGVLTNTGTITVGTNVYYNPDIALALNSRGTNPIVFSAGVFTIRTNNTYIANAPIYGTGHSTILQLTNTVIGEGFPPGPTLLVSSNGSIIDGFTVKFIGNPTNYYAFVGTSTNQSGYFTNTSQLRNIYNYGSPSDFIFNNAGNNGFSIACDFCDINAINGWDNFNTYSTNWSLTVFKSRFTQSGINKVNGGAPFGNAVSASAQSGTLLAIDSYFSASATNGAALNFNTTGVKGINVTLVDCIVTNSNPGISSVTNYIRMSGTALFPDNVTITGGDVNPLGVNLVTAFCTYISTPMFQYGGSFPSSVGNGFGLTNLFFISTYTNLTYSTNINGILWIGTNNFSGSGGGSQTPWTSDINAAGHRLDNVGGLTATGAVLYAATYVPALTNITATTANAGTNYQFIALSNSAATVVFLPTNVPSSLLPFYQTYTELHTSGSVTVSNITGTVDGVLNYWPLGAKGSHTNTITVFTLDGNNWTF